MPPTLPPFAMPPVGDYESQASAGEALISKCEAGDQQSLLAAGVALVDLFGSAGKEAVSILTDAYGGAMTGLAMAGPIGAMAGGLLGALEGASSMWNPSDSVVELLGVSAATQTITARVQGLIGASPNPWNNNPQGWAMADYCSAALPVRASRLAGLSIPLVEYCAALGARSAKPSDCRVDKQGPHLWGGLFGNATGQFLTWYQSAAVHGASHGDLGDNAPSNALSIDLATQPPLCTPVFFLWAQSSQIQDCESDMFFGSGQDVNLSALRSAWIQSVYARGGLSQAEIVRRAIAKRPDPMWWASSLYGYVMSSGAFGAGFSTVYMNPDLTNAMATELGMRSCGASSMAIASELLMQSAILRRSGSVDPSGNPLPAGPPARYAFHKFVDVAIARVLAENAGRH